MFDFDLKAKRTKLALRFFTYGVMTVASVVLTVILVFIALGYRLDNNFNFSQGGLVQFRSAPQNATVTIDGKVQSFHTPDKINLPAGQHAFTMQLDGYHIWNKSVDLAAGQLLWLNYVRLIPATITTSTLKEYPSLTDSLASPDRHWMLLQRDARKPDFSFVDYSDEQNPKYTDLQLPDDLFTKKDGSYGTFALKEWDLQSKYILVEHDNGDTVEFARIDRSKPENSVNITKLFSLNITQAHFSGDNANIVFAKTGDVLRRLDIDAKAASAALVSGLRDFTLYGKGVIAFDNIVQTTSGSETKTIQQVGVYDNGKIAVVRELEESQQVKLAYGEYDDHDYLAINVDNAPTVDIVRDAITAGSSQDTSVFATLDLGVPVAWLSFSGNGRMLVAQHGNQMATYDLEMAKSYAQTFDFGSDDTPKMRWLDDYYLWSDDGGTLRIFEFDGTNAHDITSVLSGYDVMLSSNGKQLLSIGKSDVSGEPLLQMSGLTVQN